MKIKYYAAALLSIAAVLSTLVMWLLKGIGAYASIHVSIGVYMVLMIVVCLCSYIWFAVAWMILILQIVLGVKLRKNNNSDWIHHMVASLLIIASYAGFMVIIYIWR